MSAVRSDERANGREHTVGFYDSDAALVDSVVAFVTPGLSESGAAIVVVTAEHRLAIETRLRDLGYPLDDLVACGRYVSLDARATLEQLMQHGVLDAGRFAAMVEPVITDAMRSGGAPLRIFGEMVALLWADDNAETTNELEALWNGLSHRFSFALHCGYPSAVVEQLDGLGAVRKLCDHHSQVQSLGSSDAGRKPHPALMEIHADVRRVERSFVPATVALRGVRSFVIGALDALDADALLDEAVVVASELATNAITHARSPFRLSISRDESGLEIAVRDGWEAPPVVRIPGAELIGGRGMLIVNELAIAWGSRPEFDGKTVWARLAIPSA